MDVKELISQVRRIEIRTRKMVDELVCGAYRSRFKGRGIEFDEVREYIPGDDVRDIDWNVTARMGQPFIKKYVEERELHVLLAVDISDSGLYGSGAKTKIRTQCEIAALLAFSAVRNHDKVGMITFTDKVESHLPMRSGRGHVLRMIRDLVAADPKGKGTNIAEAVNRMNQTLTKRAVIFLISDMLDKPENWSRPLRMLAQKHDVVIVRVDDQIQRQWPLSGYWNLADAESAKNCAVHTTAAFRKRFEQHNERALDRVCSEAVKAHAGLIRIESGEDVINPLMRYFNTAGRR